jgi:hypothetical protein
MCEELRHEEERLKREIHDIRRHKIQEGVCDTIVKIFDNLSDRIPIPRSISYNSHQGWRFQF